MNAEEPANEFISKFYSPIQSSVASFFAYVSGSFVAILLLLTVIDSTILVNVVIGDRPLLFYLAACSGVLAASRAMINDSSFFSAESLENLIKFTHYFPQSWRSYNYKLIETELCELYKPKVMVFLQEIISVFSTPFVLYSLSDSVEDIIDFVRDNTISEPGLGQVCSFSNFTAEETQNGDKDNAKLSKSFLTFAINHPNWAYPGNESASMIKTQMLSSANEHDLYAPSSSLRPSNHIGDSVDLNVNFSQLLNFKNQTPSLKRINESGFGQLSLRRGVSAESLGNLSMIKSSSNLNMQSIMASQVIKESQYGSQMYGLKSYRKYADNSKKLRAKNADLFLSMDLLKDLEEETRLVNEKTKELLNEDE